MISHIWEIISKLWEGAGIILFLLILILTCMDNKITEKVKDIMCDASDWIVYLFNILLYGGLGLCLVNAISAMIS